MKKFKSIQNELRRNLQKCLQNGNMLMWMTKGRITLIQKYKEKGKPVSNHKPITCLPLVWKLLTVAIVEEI